MRNFWALPAVFRLAIAAQHAFSVHNDILAFPQYEIVYAEAFISPAAAETLLESSRNASNDADADDGARHDLEQHRQSQPTSSTEEPPTPNETYERIQLSSTPYLCKIPAPAPVVNDSSAPEATPEEKQAELIRASDRGWELLDGMQDHCLYYSAGWWVYSLCYNQGIKQFHPLPPDRPGVPIFPPVEDKEIQSYILGRFDTDSRPKDSKKEAGTTDGSEEETTTDGEAEDSGTEKEVSVREAAAAAAQKHKEQHKQLQTHNSQSYLVRTLTDGTICDVTGRPRRITVQFHCDPNEQDHISMIKETASCVYQMVVHTTRLCNDVAFLPPQRDRPESVVCREIVGASDEAAWKARKAGEAETLLRGGTRGSSAHGDAALSNQKPMQPPGQGQAKGAEQPPPVIIGGVEVGGQKLVGGEPSRSIKASNIVAKMGFGAVTGEKVLATLARSDGKSVTTMTEREMKERGIASSVSREDTEKWVKKMEEMTSEKGVPWQINVVRTAGGVEFRAVLGSDEDFGSEEGAAKGGEGKKKPAGEPGKGSKDQNKQKKAKRKGSENTGSEEEYD